MNTYMKTDSDKIKGMGLISFAEQADLKRDEGKQWFDQELLVLFTSLTTESYFM